MKTLLLLRHAKSSWKDATISDHDRPLNGRGRKAAEQVRELLKAKRLKPDCVLSSSSVRTRETVEIIFGGGWGTPEIRYQDALYLAPAGKLLEAVAEVEQQYERVLLVAHNPGIENLCARLTGVEAHFPTAALANLSFTVEEWSEVLTAAPKLEWFVTPRELERE